MKYDFLTRSWCDLEWSEWVEFTSTKDHDLLPQVSGLYRVKPVGQNKLVYIGQTGRSLRVRLINELAKNTLKRDMPYNDPHTASPSLWAWKDSEGMQFECSASPVSLEVAEREALECYLLWKYRLEFGESTMCNHGRFHKNYVKSTNRNGGNRGYKLLDGLNQAGGLSAKPLPFVSSYLDSNWMGLNWTDKKPLEKTYLQGVPVTKGLYKLIDGNMELLYIGESKELKSRLLYHSKKHWKDMIPFFSVVSLPEDTLPHQLKELENDLIGAYYAHTQKPPKLQFRNFR